MCEQTLLNGHRSHFLTSFCEGPLVDKPLCFAAEKRGSVRMFSLLWMDLMVTIHFSLFTGECFNDLLFIHGFLSATRSLVLSIHIITWQSRANASLIHSLHANTFTPFKRIVTTKLWRDLWKGHLPKKCETCLHVYIGGKEYLDGGNSALVIGF